MFNTAPHFSVALSQEGDLFSCESAGGNECRAACSRIGRSPAASGGVDADRTVREAAGDASPPRLFNSSELCLCNGRVSPAA